MPKKTPTRRKKMLAHRYEVKAEISNATLAKAKSALSLQIYLRHMKLGEIQIGRGSLFWSGARRQSERPSTIARAPPCPSGASPLSE